MKARPPAVAGAFYPSGPQELKALIKKFLSGVELPKVQGEVKALIVPHAGLIYSGQTAAYGYATLKDAKKGREKTLNFILLGPSHRVGFEGVAQDEHQWWETPLGRVEICDSDSEKEKDLIIRDSRPHLKEHCLEVQLPFLQVICGSRAKRVNRESRKFTITPLLTGFEVDAQKLGEFLIATSHQPPARKERLETGDWRLETGSFLVVSSDLSHYHPQDIAEKIDKKTIQAILDLDIKTLEKEECEACGKTGILTAVYMAKKLGWKPKLLHYETSGDVTGDFSQVVGYASVGFYAV